MQAKLQNLAFAGFGMLAGALLSPILIVIAAEEFALPFSTEELQPFSEVVAKIKRNYVDPVDDNKLIQACINGMVGGLDPESDYLNAEEFKDRQASLSGGNGALGLELGMAEGFIKVVTPIDDSPASRAGVKPGDLIAKVDDTVMKGMSLPEAVRKLRGKPGSTVTLTILRKGEPRPLSIAMKRAAVRIVTVKSKLIEPGYAYVRVSQFGGNTGPDLAKQLNELYRQGQINGLILDLRNNPGGSLGGSVGVAAAFLPAGSLVTYTDGRADDAKHKYTGTAEEFKPPGVDFLKDIPAEAKNVPLVVLVNGGSASGAEMVAGALQDYKRALIMGVPTFGRPTIQTTFSLMNGTGMILTTARWFTPNGTSVTAKGIVPEIVSSEREVEPAQFGSNNDYQVQQGVVLLKSRR